jgi:hypothetical protein
MTKLNDDISNDEIEKPGKLNSKSAPVALLCSLPIFLLFCFLGRWERGIGAGICSALVFLNVRTRWDLRKHLWFWIAVIIATAFQAPFIWLVPWNDRNLTWIALLPMGLVDYSLVYGCIKLAEQLIKKRVESNSPN